MFRMGWILLFTGCWNSSAAQGEIWKGLHKGSYAVGFRSTVAFDHAQNFPYCLDSTLHLKKYPKPLIINTWYPANILPAAKLMPHEGYLRFRSQDKNISRWLDRYRAYTENILASEIIGRERSGFNDADRLQFNSFLQTKTIAVKDANPAKGKFPLIIYHQGAGASLEDNSFFCEMMASNGYVVVGSSFQKNDGTSFGVGGTEDGTMDVGFLLSFVEKLPYVDWSHSAMVGHSLGAQTVYYIAAKGNLPFDAMISLETTQEYYTDKDARTWSLFMPYVAKNAENVKVEFLFASNPPAIHELADKMNKANRYYLTIPGIAHNDFIAQGIQYKYREHKKNNNSVSQKAYDDASGDYIKLCNYLLYFLNAKLKADTAGWNNLITDRSVRMGNDFFVETMPAGKTMEAYAAEIFPVPTPRQLRFLVQSGQTDLAIERMNRSWEKGSKSPVYDPALSYAMLDYLLNTDTVNAIKLYRAYTKLLGDLPVNSQFINIGEFYMYFKLTEKAKAAFNRLYILNPDDKEKVRAILEKYKL